MKTKQGISLIVLIITIIVMIVLAGAVIISLNNSGIINNASDAVQKTDEATIKEIAALGWAQAYAMHGPKQDKLEEGVKEALRNNNLDPADYGMIVTTSGVEIAKGWLQHGLTLVKGDDTLEIGDPYTAYDETKGGTITNLTATDWQVLGVSERGELQIISTNYVGDYIRFGGDGDIKKSQSDWLNCAKILDGICEPYGKGEGAKNARSVRVEDVDKITGFDKTTYGKGEMYEYGNEVTFSYNGTIRPAYTSTNGLSGKLFEHPDGFYYYNGTDFSVADLSTATGIITTLKSDRYTYATRDIETMDETSDVYKMLFGETIKDVNNTNYWLASSHIQVYEDDHCYYFLSLVEGAGVWDELVLVSNGDSMSYGSNVRAVVTLDR